MTYPLLTAQHLKDATIVEHDPRGIKVFQLPNGDYVKIFRLRRRYSWARFNGYAQRFCKHAAKLSALGIPTVKVIACYQVKDASLLSHSHNANRPVTSTVASAELHHTYAVHYAPLPGHTLKDMLYKGSLTTAHVKQLGEFIAQLHTNGVHFRSLHLGNIVLTPEGKLGLIDIADMSIYPWSLWFTTRLRSFRHLTRYQALNHAFGEESWDSLIQSYLDHARLIVFQAEYLKKRLTVFLAHAPH